MARLHPTLADYVVIAISPALIMALVGSLVFFLLEVFYQGQYGERMTFIMAMFVMATVLIARISIAEGREYAALFAVPLGIVTLIAMLRFVEFRGALAGFSTLINIGLLALIWWCADRLTWDCTVIDESKDASGEGLLQTVGLDQDPAVQESSPQAQPSDTDGTTDRDTPKASGSLWQKFVASRHRAHPHGVWVVYFSLAALPLFGIGQWFVQANDLASRRYVFQLMVLYVAAALGLLLTTSFLGLRRYLRQRRLEMPSEMAGVWMGTGAAIIVGLLLLCLLLPRRNAEYSITHLPAFAGSPDDLWTSDWGFGSDGPEEDDAKRQVTRDDAQQTTDSENGQQPGGQSDSSQLNGGDGKGRSSDQSRQGQGKQAESRQDASKQQASRDAASQDGSSQDDSSQDDSVGDSPSGQESSGQPAQSEESSDRQQKADPDGSHDQGRPREQPTSSQSDQSGRSSTRQQSQDQGDRPREADRQSQQQADSSSDSKSQPSPSRQFDPSKLISQLGAGLGGLLKLLYWLIFILVVLYLLWRYHAQIGEALRNFMQSLREFWERLFGGGREATAVEQADARPQEPAPRPFSAFPDPFLSGAADAWPTDQLVKYSFEALEAWARERGCGRFPEQTPFEFAQRLAHREAAVGQDALRLAELYNLSAYAQRSAPQSSVSHIRRLWECLAQG
jgi:hypothetical protein